MTIAVLFDCSDSTLDQYNQVFEVAPELADQPGCLNHACISSGQGFLFIDIWESEDAFARFGQALGPVLDKVGLHPVHVRVVHRVIAGALRV